MHDKLRQWMSANISEAVANSVRIIYGGKGPLFVFHINFIDQ